MLRVNFSASLLQIVDLDEKEHSLKTEIIFKVVGILTSQVQYLTFKRGELEKFIKHGSFRKQY